MNKRSLVSLLAVALVAPACAAETDDPTNDEAEVAVDTTEVGPRDAPRDASNGLATGRRPHSPLLR